MKHESTVNCVIALSDGCIVSGGDDNKLKVWDTKGEYKMTLEGSGNKVSHLVALSNNRMMASFKDGLFEVWNMNTGSNISMLLNHNSKEIKSWVAMLSDGRMISCELSYPGRKSMLFLDDLAIQQNFALSQKELRLTQLFCLKPFNFTFSLQNHSWNELLKAKNTDQSYRYIVSPWRNDFLEYPQS